MKKLWLVLLSAVLLTALFAFPAMAEETPPVCETYSEAVLAVREQMKARNGSFSIIYTGEDPIDIEDVLAYEGSAPDEGDYLRWSVNSFTEKDYADGECAFSVSYKTTAEKEQAVNETVSDIITGITADTAPAELTDYKKALLIYDWICDNITYTSAYGGYSADTALVEKTARCGGYAMAYYRLAREMGLDCRILTGLLSTDEAELSHAWNAVKIGESWYCLDSTHGAWEDEETNEATDRRAFFLMPATREGIEYLPEYTDGTNYLKTPLEIEAYPFDAPITGACAGHGWTLYPTSGQLTLSATADENAQESHWANYSMLVNTVTATDADGLCENCLLQSGLPLHCGADSAAAAYAEANGIPCHTPAAQPEISPTCKSTGISAGTVCETCMAYLTGGELLPVTDDHTDDGNGVCSVCGIVIDCVDHGFCGKDVRWYLLDTGELVITGTGKMKDYCSISNPFWAAYLEMFTNLTVQNGITELGAYAFSYAVFLQNVDIADSVTNIGIHTFDHCIEISHVSLSADLYEISDYAFYYCESLEEIDFPYGLERIGSRSFSHTGLISIYIPATIKDALSSVLLSPFGTMGPFSYSSLKSIEFQEGLKCIPSHFCEGAKQLEEVILPNSIEIIDKQAFYYCSSLSFIQLPLNLVMIEQTAFVISGLETVVVQKNLKTASGLKMAKNIVFSENTEEIPKNFSNEMESLEFVYIPESITSIGEKAFYNCKNLKTVYIGANDITIESNAFALSTSSLVFHCSPNSNATSYKKMFLGLVQLEETVTCHTSLDYDFSYKILCNSELIPDYISYCPDCDKIITRTGMIDRVEHILTSDAAVAATCTADGKTEGSHCAVCGTVFTAQETVPALGHMDILAPDEAEDGVCDVCGTVLWTKPAEPEEPSQPEEPAPSREPVRIVQWSSRLYEGLAKLISNIIKLFSRMFGK